MTKFFTPKSAWLVIAAGLVIFILSSSDFVTQTVVWQKAEGALIDQRYHWRGEIAANTNIVIVGVDTGTLALDELSPAEIDASETLKLMRQPWPWDRRVHAAVLDKLVGAGAKVVLFDFVFTGEKEGNPEFSAALQRHQARVVVGSHFQGQGLDYQYEPPTSELVPSEMTNIVGLANQWPDPDQILRRGNYRTSIEREHPSPLLAVFGTDRFPDNLPLMSTLAVEKFTGHVDTPPYGHDNFIDFEGASGTYPMLPLEKMFVDRLWSRPPFDGGTVFSNKIVIVGPYAEIFKDAHITPFGLCFGPEVQAQEISTLLRHASLRELSPGMVRLLNAVMVLLALVVCLGPRRVGTKLLLLFAALVLFCAGSQYDFTHDRLVIPMVAPLLCLLATGTLGSAAGYVRENAERQRYRRILDRYVSGNVAEVILRDKSSFAKALSGQKLPVTILFSDIRGFAGLAGNQDPHELVAQLNEYLYEMVEAVQGEAGTLQKFIGDAVMAAWGDTHPVSPAEGSQRAVRAALRMRTALVRLNQRWHDQPGRVPLVIGIGVNHDEVVVGDIGHPSRMEFTVLGEGVNLAARLESATKEFAVDILVGENVEALTRDAFIYRRVDLLVVKGHSRPVEVFLPLAEKTQPAPIWLAGYHEAIALYRAGKFLDAKAMFEDTLSKIGTRDVLCSAYIHRCNSFIHKPPPPGWGGWHTLTTK